MNALFYRVAETIWGPVRLAASAGGICAVGLPGYDEEKFLSYLHKKYPGMLVIETGAMVLDEAAVEINEYLAGRLKEFTVPFHVRVTPFQFRVLEAISTIPYGSTRTYGELAQEIGRPGAARAVAAACGANPVPLIVPCHRVVAANNLGGFRGGVALKRRLLELEGWRRE